MLDWLYAFMWGGGAAIFQLALFGLFARGYPLNRLILGVNLYLMLGGGAVLSSQMTLLEMLNDLKESSIFLCLLIVGIVTTVASKAGFVGVVQTPRQRDVKRYSLYLLGLTFAALAASFWFRGQITLSAAIPLIVLSVATRWFKWRLQRDQHHRADANG